MTSSRGLLAAVVAIAVLAACTADGDPRPDLASAASVTAQVRSDAYVSTASTTGSDGASRALRCSSADGGGCVYVTTTTALLSAAAAAAPPATFEGMWDHDPSTGGHMAELCGYLVIEEPYVHVLETERDWGQDDDPGLARSEDGSLVYSMIMLPRPGTRYDPATRSLWVYREGPMTDGDHVSVSGGVGYRQPDWPGPNVHQRSLWQANGMGPTDYPC